ARAAANAENYPIKPVRLVAASAPGGGIDIIGRVIAQRLSEMWNQQVVVDNRAGGGGVIATGIVAKAPADGYTLLVQSVGVSYVQTLHKDAPFDVLRDLTPVAKVASQPSLLAVHSSVPASSLAELLKLAKAKPGQLSFGTGGAGGASHMGTELFAHAANIKLVHVPYKGTGPSMAALLAGEVNMAMVGVATALPHVKAGKIKPIGVTGSSRSAILPDIPTIAEAGVPGYEFAGWYGIFAPGNMPRGLTQKINADINKILQQPETMQRLAAIGFEPQSGSADEFAKYFRAEVVKWRKVIKDAGIAAS
ncbi:MAG: Bug family tripartite tricarboxylate transporter substrate binding protein, partial [Rhodospirillaceae bacterium]